MDYGSVINKQWLNLDIEVFFFSQRVIFCLLLMLEIVNLGITQLLMVRQDQELARLTLILIKQQL